MARSTDINHVEVEHADGTVEMSVDEVKPRRGPPMTEQARLDVRWAQRLAKQRVVHQIDLADRKVIGGTPISVE